LRVVRRHGDIGWLIVAARIRDETLHFDDAVLRIDDRVTARCAGGQSDEIAEHSVAERVMGDLVYALILIGRHSDDVKNQ
jgi:hypothetical protein